MSAETLFRKPQKESEKKAQGSGAASNSGTGLGFVPEGHLRIAQRFSVEKATPTIQVPKGRLKRLGFSRPFGTYANSKRVPNVETLGYYQVSLRDKSEL